MREAAFPIIVALFLKGPFFRGWFPIGWGKVGHECPIIGSEKGDLFLSWELKMANILVMYIRAEDESQFLKFIIY